VDRTEPPGTFGFRSRANFNAVSMITGLRQMVADLEDRDLRINRTSRTPTYVAEVIKCLQLPRPLTDPVVIARFRTALVEGQLLLDTYRGLSMDPVLSGWESHFGRALKGRFDLREEDPSRNKLLELIIAASARRSGLVARLEEPDVVIGEQDWELAVAAKRIANMDRLEERVREGTEQIERRGIHGFVVVDLTIPLGFHNPAEVDSASDLPRLQDEVRDKIAASIPDQVIYDNLRDRPHAVGVVGFTYLAAHISRERRLGRTEVLVPATVTDGRPRPARLVHGTTGEVRLGVIALASGLGPASAAGPNPWHHLGPKLCANGVTWRSLPCAPPRRFPRG